MNVTKRVQSVSSARAANNSNRMPHSPYKSPSSLSPLSLRFAAEAERENIRRLQQECNFLSAALTTLQKGSSEWELIKSKLDIARDELDCELEDSKIIRCFESDEVDTDGKHVVDDGDNELSTNNISTPPLLSNDDKGKGSKSAPSRNLAVSMSSIPTLPLVELDTLHSGACHDHPDSGLENHITDSFTTSVDLSSEVSHLQQRGDSAYSDQVHDIGAIPRNDNEPLESTAAPDAFKSRGHPNLQAVLSPLERADNTRNVEPKERGFENDQLGTKDPVLNLMEVQKYSIHWFRLKGAIKRYEEKRNRDVKVSTSDNSTKAKSDAKHLEQNGKTLQLESHMQQPQQGPPLKGEYSIPIQKASNETEAAPMEKYSLEWFASKKLGSNASRNKYSTASGGIRHEKGVFR